MAAVIQFPPSGKVLPGPVQRWRSPLPTNVRPLRRFTRSDEPDPISVERLMLLAMFFAMSREARETARAFLTVADPTRSNPATEMVEEMMRRIRQLG